MLIRLDSYVNKKCNSSSTNKISWWNPKNNQRKRLANKIKLLNETCRALEIETVRYHQPKALSSKSQIYCHCIDFIHMNSLYLIG